MYISVLRRSVVRNLEIIILHHEILLSNRIVESMLNTHHFKCSSPCHKSVLGIWKLKHKSDAVFLHCAENMKWFI